MHTAPRIALALSVLLVACPKRVTVSGQEMSETAAQAEAIRELRRFQDETSAEPPAAAAEKYEALAARYATVPASADALYEAGVRWRQAGQPDRARSAFSRLVERWPLSPLAPQAKYALALAEADSGRPKEALT